MNSKREVFWGGFLKLVLCKDSVRRSGVDQHSKTTTNELINTISEYQTISFPLKKNNTAARFAFLQISVWVSECGPLIR